MENLTAKNKLQVQIFKLKTSLLGEEEAKNLLVEMYVKMLHTENKYKETVKQNWGI
jgi:hypothetical protein